MHLKSTFGFCADIVWNILSPDSKSSTHSIHVWYIYIYMYHKKSTRCREIDQSHGSYGVWFRVDYLPSLCCFRSFFVSQITKTSEMLKVGDTGGSMGKPRCPLQEEMGCTKRWILEKVYIDSKQPETSYESYVYQININWYTVYMYIYVYHFFIYININIYLHIWLVLLIPRNRDFFFFDTTQISMAWNWEVGNDGR